MNDTEAAEQLDIEAERRQRAGIGADAEERDVAEAELAGIAEQQVEAHRGDDEDAGRDQRVQEIGIAAATAAPTRTRASASQGATPLHPIRSVARTARSA